MDRPAFQYPVNAAVLIGGGSTRMGSPKTLLRAGNRFVMETLVAVAAEVANQVVLAGRASIPPALSAMTRLDDVPGIEGPLAGLLAAFRRQPERAWILLSCDLPFMSAEALRWLLSQMRPEVLAVMPHLDSSEIPEPLAALYLPNSSPLLEQAAREGQRSIRRILQRDNIFSPRAPERLQKAFRNVNTPEEWRAAIKEMENNAGSHVQGVA